MHGVFRVVIPIVSTFHIGLKKKLEHPRVYITKGNRMKNNFLVLLLITASCFGMDDFNKKFCTTSGAQPHCAMIAMLLRCATQAQDKPTHIFCEQLKRPYALPQDQVQREVYGSLPTGPRESHLAALEKDVAARGMAHHAIVLADHTDSAKALDLMYETCALIRSLYKK